MPYVPSVNEQIEACDNFFTCYTARVILRDWAAQLVLVHFDGWNNEYDVQAAIDAGRLYS